MKKWLKFFFLGFFSHDTAKEGRWRGYTNTFLSFLLALAFIWAGFVGADMLPFGAHFNNSPDFRATVYSALANTDENKRLEAKIKEGDLLVKKWGGEYTESLFINTLESAADKESYSVGGYDIVVDTRPADTLAEFVAYCVSNDGKNNEISYEDYLTLSEVAKLNFDFKLRYTGNPLTLTDEAVEGYISYLNGSGDESKAEAERHSGELADGKITADEYNRRIYELYFKEYYPDITEYEKSSAVPLLRNYYYHTYIAEGIKNYLFIFDDYMTGSFETKGGIEHSFNGFYANLEDGAIVSEGATESEARASVDSFIFAAFGSIASLNLYMYAMNTFSLLPFIGLMLLVATLLTYSILRLRGADGIGTLGKTLRVVGAFLWFSGAISTVLSVALSFFVTRNLINALPPVIFFVALVTRSVIFALWEGRLTLKQSEPPARQTED